MLGQVFSVADRIALGDTAGGEDELRTFPDTLAAGRVVQALLVESYDTPAARLARAIRDVPPWLSSAFVGDAQVIPRLAAGYPCLGAAGGITSSSLSCAAPGRAAAPPATTPSDRRRHGTHN